MTTKTKAAIALTAGTNLRSILLAGLAVIALASCGSGGDDEEGHEVPGLVTIEAPTESPTYTTASKEMQLSGSRSDDVFAVSWSNAAGGGGEASLSSRECYFFSAGPFTCNTEWRASIPLVGGENVITVTASGSNGHWGRDTITITRFIWAPTVSSTTPFHTHPSFPVFSAISAVFVKKMASASITEATFQLVDGSGNPVSGNVTYTDSVLTWNPFTGTYTATGNVATFTPANLLAAFSPYTATITDGVKDVDGNSMADNYVWSFTTGAPNTTPPR